MRCFRFLLFSLLAFYLLNEASAFPNGRPVANKTKFSRERVKLQNSRHNDNVGDAVAQSPLVPREALIRFDVLVGLLYSTLFFLLPGQTLSLFFNYDFDPSIKSFLHLAVRMIAINHAGYVGGLLAAPPEKAIRVATGFLTIGGAFVVYYGQAKLDTAVAFWSCTILTTAMIVAHILAL